MVQDELATILVKLEAGLALAIEAAAAFDTADQAGAGDADEKRLWLRLATACAKYQTAEEANRACRAAIEIIGGNGYTYDHVTPRLLRDAQVMTVWEGPANIQALEVLRLVAGRYPGAEVFAARVELVLAASPPALDAVAAPIRAALDDWREALAYMRGDAAEAARHGRRLMALMADILAAALLLQAARSSLAKGDCRKALVARLFVEAQFVPPARRGILPGRDWLHRHFRALADYAAIAPGPRGAMPWA
jgi:acyl-CoA dehydrogenase